MSDLTSTSMTRTPARVLYCESNTDGTIGGSHYCLLHLVERLDRTQFEPLVVFQDEHALVPRFRAAAETLVLPRYAPVQWGASSERSGNLLALPLVLIRRAINLVKYARTVGDRVSFLRRQRIKLVHLNNSITRHHDWMQAAFLAGVPCIVHERGLNPHYRWSDLWGARRVALVVPMSRWIQDHMVERGLSPDNIRVMYDGLDPETIRADRSPEAIRAEYGIRPDQPVVGIVGNVREWKGQETVVRALIEVVKTHRELVCFFIGASTAEDVAYVERLNRLIADAGIQANVRFTGYQNDPASFIRTMGFVMHASVQPEPFGMVVLEAMAQHKAVIGSRAGGVIEMVVEGETGYTFPPGHWQTLASQMLELLGAPAKADQMGEAGYARLINHFTMQRYMDEIHRTYRAVLAGEPVPGDVGLAAQAKVQ
jgi:glycosyltransferase involved in cell wall biosynthesis